MNKKEKKKPNIVLYTLSMLFIFVFVAEVIIYGFGGDLLFNSITKYPQGNLVIGEIVLSAMVLIVMLLFKNSYVFTQKREPLKTGLFYGLFYIIGSVIFMLLFGVFNGGFNSGLALINLFVGCLLIGICEEFLCRGWLLNEFLERYGNSKKGIWYSIVISGLIFGLMHIGNIFSAGQDVPSTITQVISATGTGIVFGLIYYKTKNIWSVVILHGLWDFSLFLGDVTPVTEEIVTVNGFSIVGILFSILIILAELLNVIPHINDIDGKPEKKSVITYAVVGIVFMFIFTLCSGMSSMKFGDIYEYGNLSLEHYAITRDNYVEYKIDDTIKLSVNDQKNLVLSNLNTNYSFEIECESLYDYIIADLNDYYVLAYIDYENSSNAFLNYVYISKSENLNNNQYLNTLKNNIKKYLLPTRAELVVLDDYDNDKSYLTAYHIDYGYYVLVSENEMSVLNRD